VIMETILVRSFNPFVKTFYGLLDAFTWPVPVRTSFAYWNGILLLLVALYFCIFFYSLVFWETVIRLQISFWRVLLDVWVYIGCFTELCPNKSPYQFEIVPFRIVRLLHCGARCACGIVYVFFYDCVAAVIWVLQTKLTVE
jgi:hypothetical protein